jgi:hypothetical protein
MTYVKPVRLLFACATILVLASTLSCTGPDRNPKNDSAVWFVQVTDPHLFLDTSKDADAAKKLAREKQEKLDQSALSDLWKQLPSLSHVDRPLSFLVVTGDFGIEPCSIADIPLPATSPNKPTAKDCLDKVNPDKRKSQITVLADSLGASPVRDIYLVPGNNDIPFETASDDGLVYFNKFIDEVQKKIDDSNKNVQLHNLSSCYLANGAASTCYADIPDTSYRLLSFPSYSFKNREPGYESNTPSQEKQFETFRTLLDASRRAGKRVLILTHTPLIDDPYTLAQDRYAGATPPDAIDKDPKNARSAWSTWNVSKKLADEWEEAVASDSVVAVFAGHLHDSHKEIYHRPYLWSTANDHKTGFSKLYMAPPLSVKNQDTSPLQARGFSLVGLDPDRINYRIYWYYGQTGDFTADPSTEPRERKWLGRGSWLDSITATLSRCFRSFWESACPRSLDQWAVLLIALLAAFLTVVQIWQIPEPENPLTGQTQTPAAPGGAGGAQTGSAQTGTTKSAFDPSPFASNFAKTVIAGLGGLAAETVLKSLEGKPSASDKEFYIAWFVAFFFLTLFTSAFLRALGEALRERVSIVHANVEPPRRIVCEKPRRFWQALAYWLLRFVTWLIYWLWYWLGRFALWLLSLRFWLLTFVDTFINLIQGKNQTLTRLFSDTIVKQQRNVVCVAQVMRERLNDMILRHLNSEETKEKKKWCGSRDVRVNISVLSADQSRVFYIARTPGSGIKAFTKRSVAWVSVFTGKMRWYKHDYFREEIVLFDNSKGVIPDGESDVMLRSYYQEREDDYEAFIIIPVPWPQRAFGSGYVKGAIHISFRDQEQFHRIWNFQLDEKDRQKLVESRWQALTEEQRKPLVDSFWEDLRKRRLGETNDPVLLSGTYKFEEKMLGDWCVNPEVKACLRQALAILGQLLYDFNEDIYNSSKQGGDCGS